MKTKSVYFASLLGFAAFAGLYYAPAGTFVSLICAFAVPALFLFAVRRCDAGKQRLFVGFAFTAGMIYMNLHYSSSVLLDIVAFSLSAVYISLAFILDIRFRGNDRRFVSTLIFPAAWVSLLQIASIIHMGFQFRLDAFVTPLKAFSQIESIIGSSGVLFLLLWTASVVVFVIEKKDLFPRIGLSVWAVIMASSIIFGAVRLHIQESEVSVIRTAYTTGPYVGDFIDYVELDYEVYAECLENAAKTASEGGAELLVFNEEAFFFPDNLSDEFSNLLSELAIRYGLNILSGEEVYDSDATTNGKHTNRISFYDSKGQLAFRYVKHSLVPIIETAGIVPGKAELPSAELEFSSGRIKLASCICYDSNFSSYISSIPDDTQLLIIPSWDWNHVSDYHGEVARQLAIENGTTVFKNTYDGISYLFSPLGETLHSSDTSESGYAKVHFVDIPVQSRSAVFSIIGPYFSWIITAASAVSFIFLELRKRMFEGRII